ncbi:MAG TPA: SRPBCC family protein [Kineosporiaceae bacterium]|nr:SRPBCC family protein [Kineosporiaceae bacterium]
MTEPTQPTYQDGYQPSPIMRPQRTFADGRWTVILSRELSHPVKRVWEALTEPGQLRQWAPFTADRNLETPGDVVMTMLESADPSGDADQTACVLESEPPRLLVYRWGGDVLRWELTGTADGTTVVLRHTLADPGMASASAAGWHICLDAADALIKGVPFGPAVGSKASAYGWPDLNRRYAEILDVKPSFT